MRLKSAASETGGGEVRGENKSGSHRRLGGALWEVESECGNVARGAKRCSRNGGRVRGAVAVWNRAAAGVGRKRADWDPDSAGAATVVGWLALRDAEAALALPNRG